MNNRDNSMRHRAIRIYDTHEGRLRIQPYTNYVLRTASTSNIKSSVSVLEDSDDEVDEVLEMEGGGFLNDMEDYYDGYDDQVVLPDKLQAICDQFDIRLNTRRR
ncbi:hypothetical protein CTI12_AA447820 [Artemisia annua]|uniref:Uncharacterized protein n=1 Tax=Artemisia annua TaxID=35608 RepID=A0A2U1LVT8_ARTAN|nr:hypothetical protein CTI12_AA447820 [Artemisia annua]